MTGFVQRVLGFLVLGLLVQCSAAQMLTLQFERAN